ncbi:MAG TPA: hypothetical protein DIW47_12460 [Bacteroidetes bacterium]|nr:hypothetical protein [Bacteroidota bacterium]
MKTNKNTWEDKLSKHLGDDASRFPLSEGEFASLKDRILTQKDAMPVQHPKTHKLRALWLLTLPAAAALAFFLINKAEVPVDTRIDPVSLNEASEGLYEQISEQEQVLVLEEEVAKALAESGRYDELQSEVVLEDYLYEELEVEKENSDPLDGLETAEIEEYLVDHVTLIYEL